MTRERPSNSFELVYITTITAERGRLEDLEKVLTDHSTGQGNTYLAVQNVEEVEFDVYIPKRQTRYYQGGRTDTDVFRKDLGWLLTVLLQCGYENINKIRVDELIKPPEGPIKPTLDF